MKKQSEYQAKYDATHTRRFFLKLNLETDKDLIEILEKSPNKQLLIKTALREYAKKS